MRKILLYLFRKKSSKKRLRLLVEMAIEETASNRKRAIVNRAK